MPVFDPVHICLQELCNILPYYDYEFAVLKEGNLCSYVFYETKVSFSWYWWLLYNNLNSVFF